MGTIQEILVPQMGEGLQEVRIVELHKQPGDYVKRDEILYSMETDKSVMEVESPYEGVLKEWLTEADAILAIGAPVALIESANVGTDASVETPLETDKVADEDLKTMPESKRDIEIPIPPRTRAYGREKGLTDTDLRGIPVSGSKLMPADIDAYLATCSALDVTEPSLAPTAAVHEEWIEKPLSRQHRTFIYRLKRSAQIVVPAVAKRTLPWSGIRHFTDRYRAQQTAVQPSAFQTFAYCVAQAVKKHPKFRSVMLGDENIREFSHVNLGIAVGGAEGQLNTAVVKAADALDFETFIQTAQSQIQLARDGQDQASESTQLLLTYMGPYEITDAIPVLVAPAMGVLFIGATFEQNGEATVNLVLTFEHRLINGIEAAEFLRTVVEEVKQLPAPHPEIV